MFCLAVLALRAFFLAVAGLAGVARAGALPHKSDYGSLYEADAVSASKVFGWWIQRTWKKPIVSVSTQIYPATPLVAFCFFGEYIVTVLDSVFSGGKLHMKCTVV